MVYEAQKMGGVNRNALQVGFDVSPLVRGSSFSLSPAIRARALRKEVHLGPDHLKQILVLVHLRHLP
jgi:hypothetical protein